ncbi:unnamed protein product [Lymnaea stagnalis]|uniref:Uncharacterized protein n=1 Tax=Lymnaea stagnalis TaxID=6523 RepID=A0AAV2HA84_LYMST
MAKLPGQDFRFRAFGVENSVERRDRQEHESELGCQAKRRPDSSSRRLGDLLEAPRSATGGNADRFDRGDYRPCLPDDNVPYQKQEDGWQNEESNKIDNLTIHNSNNLYTEETDPEKKKFGADNLHDEVKTEASFPEIPSEESSFSKMWPNPWDWPTPVRFERPVPLRLNSFRHLTFTGMSPEDIKKAKERSRRSQEESSSSAGVSAERAKARPWNDYLLNKFNKGGHGAQKKKKTMKFKLAYDDANCECTLIPCQKSGQPKPNTNKTGDGTPTVEVCSSSQSDSNTDITQKQRRVTVRMRKILPPPQPKKLCFQTMLSGCTHSEVRREIETQANVKVTLLQYDPIRLQAFKNASLTEEHCCMWIFELSPLSNAEHLLFEGINLRGLHMNVRPLDDVYREEHIAYTLCTEIYSEQQKKRLTQRSNLKLPRACRKRFSFK